MIDKILTIREDQNEWLEENEVNASRLFREAIDNEREDLSGIDTFRQ
jgi:hypothetical protein